MILMYFLVDLMRDARRQESFSRDPMGMMKQAGLSDRQIDLIRREDLKGIGEALAAEVGDFSSGLRLPYPSSDVKVVSVAPDQGQAGASLQVNVEGLFFEKEATCVLRSGDETIPGNVVSLESTILRSVMVVAFDLPEGASPGDWNVVVTNPQGYHDSLPQSFAIVAPATSAASPG
jgi:hypothetical protein